MRKTDAARDAGTSHEDPDPPDPDRPDPDKPDPVPDAAVHTPDPPNEPDEPDDGDKDDGDKDDGDGGAAANVPGKVVDVGQGVKLIAPPGYPVKHEDGNVIIGDPMKLAVIAGPITEKSNDPDVLARTYAAADGPAGHEHRDPAGRRCDAQDLHDRRHGPGRPDRPHRRAAPSDAAIASPSSSTCWRPPRRRTRRC